MVAGHRQHVADLAGLEPGPQGGVGAVGLVAGHPPGRHPGVQRPREHGLCQRRLGRKPHLAGDAGGPAAVAIVSPDPGHVQLPVDQGVPGAAGVHQPDGDLGVLNPAGGAGVLALHPNRRRALLQV